MSKRVTRGLIHYVRDLVAVWRQDPRTDAELLDTFANSGDEGAFTALVARYGAVVWNTCASVIGDTPDAEDAFQAVFIALARNARRLRREPLGGWLATVARNAALKAREADSRRTHGMEQLAAVARTANSTHDIDSRSSGELRDAVLDEVTRLPEKLRVALMLYYLEGKTQAEVGHVIGVSDRAVAGRLEQGLTLLRQRMAERGLTVSAGVIVAVLASMPTARAMPDTLAMLVVQLAAEAARGVPLTGPAAAIADGLGRSSLKFRIVTAVAIVIIAAAGTAMALMPAKSPTPNAPLVATADDSTSQQHTAQVEVDKRLNSTVVPLTGHVTDSRGIPVPGATVSALVRRPWAPGDRGLRDDVVAKVTTGVDGGYMLTVPADFATHYPERSVTLLISGTGLPTTTKLVRLHAGRADVGIPTTRSVRGVLIGLDGKPASGVRVGVVRLGSAAVEPVQGQESKLPDGWPAEVASGADGVFTVDGLPAEEDVWVEVRDDRFALSTVRFKAGESNLVQVSLAAPRVLEGKVIASDTGKPLAGVRVSVYAGPQEGHTPRITAVNTTAEAASEAPAAEFDTVSGLDGSFRFRLPPTGPYLVSVYPSKGSAYLGLRQGIVWKSERTHCELLFKLPIGRIVRSVMKDDAGQPVADGWVMYQPSCDNHEVPIGMLTGRDAPVRTAKDGSFAMAVPPGPGSLEGWGPALNYRPDSYELRKNPAFKEGRRSFEHALVELADDSKPLSLTVRRGESIRVAAVDNDGKPIASGVAVCRSVVRPLRNQVPQPLPIRDGSLELPGCALRRVYPIALFDAERQLGAVAEVSVGNDKSQVKLEHCGTAEAKLVDLARRPLSGVPAVAVLLLDCDRVATSPASNTGEWVIDQSWFDPKHHLPRTATDANGQVAFRALIPNADYAVYFLVQEKIYASSVFRVAPGRAVQVPEVIAILGHISLPTPMPMSMDVPLP